MALSPRVLEARARWIRTERAVAIIGVAVLVLLAALLWPASLPPSPDDLIAAKPKPPDCPEFTGLRSIDLAAELAKSEPDFTDAMLRGADLRDQNFVGVSFQNANFDAANIEGAVFEQSDLTCADLRAVEGNAETLFLFSNLLGTDLSGAVLPGSVFSLSSLAHADLSNANLEGANLSGNEGRGVDLIGVELDGTLLSEARLRYADISFADYRPVDWPDAGAAATVIGLDKTLLNRNDTSALKLLASAFKRNGLDAQARVVQASIARWERHYAMSEDPSATRAMTIASEFYNGWIAADGSQPLRPFALTVIATLAFGLVYWFMIFGKSGPSKLQYKLSVPDGDDETAPIPPGPGGRFLVAVVFSLANASLFVIPLVGFLEKVRQAGSIRIPYTTSGAIRLVAVGQFLVTAMLLSHYLPI